MVAVVEDDGSGLNVTEVVGASSQRKGLGPATIQDRAGMLGGELQIESRIGRGAKARQVLPMDPK